MNNGLQWGNLQWGLENWTLEYQRFEVLFSNCQKTRWPPFVLFSNGLDHLNTHNLELAGDIKTYHNFNKKQATAIAHFKPNEIY